jgi:hypothetical protein
MNTTSVPAIPHKPSVLCLTDDEIADIEEMIAKGQLPPDWLERCDAARELCVFGEGFKRDRNGVPIEQGLGSESQMSANSIEAYKKWCKDEPDFDRHLARMQKLLDEQRAQRTSAKPRPGRR